MSHSPRRGFTLIELLVVILIILLVSAVTLPTVIPALSNRHVSESARILQAGLAGARDAAIRANAPRGIRLLADPTFTGGPGNPFAANRFVAIEPAPDLLDGVVTFPSASFVWTNAKNFPPAFPFPVNQNINIARGNYPVPPNTTIPQVLMIEEAIFIHNVPPAPNPPTSWFWNVRIGDRFRFNDSGRYYTVVGPMTTPNPELFVNDGPAGNSSLQETYNDFKGKAHVVNPEFLFLVNGVDDDGDGYIDNGVNGINENENFYDSSIPGLSLTSGIPVADDIAEWTTEVETWLGSQATQSTTPVTVVDPTNSANTLSVPAWSSYTIARRPVPSPNALEVSLPAGAVIDMTTWDSTRERSRLPVDPSSGFVDVMLNQSGQVIPTTTYSNPGSASMDASFYHFWIADRTDVYPPGATIPSLPIPAPPSGITYNGVNNVLKKDRHLVSLFTRTGQVVTNSIENFDFQNAYGYSGNPYDSNIPFDDAQLGIREAK